MKEVVLTGVNTGDFGRTTGESFLDLLKALKGKTFDRVMISESMLRENSDCFLDDMTVDEVRRTIGKPLTIVENNGDALLRTLYALEDCHE